MIRYTHIVIKNAKKQENNEQNSAWWLPLIDEVGGCHSRGENIHVKAIGDHLIPLYSLSCDPGTVIGTGDRARNDTKIPALMALTF